jgi:hypothetical protein
MIEPSTRFKALEEPLSDDIGSRTSRRRKVVALYGSYFLICAATAARSLSDSLPGRIIAGALLLAGIAAAAYGFVSLMGRTFVNAPNIRESILDERQRQRRNDAIQRSLPAIGMFSAFCLAYTTISDTLIPGLRNGAVAEAMFWGIFLLCVSLPSAIIAWTEPDPLTLDTP